MKPLLAVYLLLGTATAFIFDRSELGWSANESIAIIGGDVVVFSLVAYARSHARKHGTFFGMSSTACVFGPVLSFVVGFVGGICVLLFM